MNTETHYYHAGMGAACATTATWIGKGMQTAGGALATIPTAPTLIAAAVLEVGAMIQNLFFSPDCNKIATTQIVNQAEKLLQQNLQAWQSLSAAEKTPAVQQAALANFDNVWNQVVQACSTGGYGTAGQNCVGDRQQGACHYTNSNGCWNWFVGYRDPIANDPAVVANAAASVTAPVTDVLSQLTGGAAGGTTNWLLLGGLALLVFAVGYEMS